ncbi:MAG: PD-(D/E)XK nuclease family protein [Bacteroidota bacterium]|jgi:hypothetical protein
MDKSKLDMTVWSPTSWNLWKTCPAKYRIKKVERWQRPDLKEDSEFAKLAIPGLVVDRMLQFWLHRKRFADMRWVNENIGMVWSMIESEIHPQWSTTEEIRSVKEETWQGLRTAIRMLEELHIEEYDLRIQPTFFEKITASLSVAGSADLLLVGKNSVDAVLIDFKNAHRRERITKDQLVIYQIGLKKKTPYNFTQSGYLMFNPRLEQWKWFKIGTPHEEKMIEKLALATEQVLQQKFDYTWNHFTCPRFCDVRFACEMFQRIAGKTIPAKDSKSKIFLLAR